MMPNIQRRLKIDSPHFNCFFLKSQILRSYWKRDILMLLIYSHSTYPIQKEWALKYGKISQKYLGNTVSRNELTYYAITGYDVTSFLYINGKKKQQPIKRSHWKSRCVGLIEWLGEIKSLIITDIDNFWHLFKLFLMAELFTNFVL